MKHFVYILAFLTSANTFCFAQIAVGIKYPESAKKTNVYFSPYVIYGVSPGIDGVVNFGDTYDSLKFFSLIFNKYYSEVELYHETHDSLRFKYQHQIGLTVIVDTSQEISREEVFYETYKYDRMFASPRYLTLIDKKAKKTMQCNKQRKIFLKAMPVYIVNYTSEIKKIYDQDTHVNIVQEVLDPNGLWQEMEVYQTGACGMAWGWKNLYPNQFIVTSILKYAGDFKTVSRIKYDNGTIYYSKPYTISVNSNFFAKPIRTTSLDGFVMELE
jgi:hypothetical protein